jgi:DNA-binding LacI/PurR family transcriptional regulator
MNAAPPALASGSSRSVVMMDVARAAGVSQKTVSRVVNGAPHVRADVRERVNRAIKDLGYRPNVAAQALARERSHTIGVLALGTPLIGPSRRVFTLEHEARRLGYTMALTSVPDLSARSVANGIDALQKRGVEGLVVEVPTHLIDLDPTQLAGLPVVTSAGWISGVSSQAVVDIDQEEACRELTGYLLGLGHQTVWHVAGPRDWDAAEKRLDGWRSALRASGRHVPRVHFGDWSAASGYQEGRRLAARDDVTAIFAANDHMAMGILSVTRVRPDNSGRRIGGRLRRCSRSRISDGAVVHSGSGRERGRTTHPGRTLTNDRRGRSARRGDQAARHKAHHPQVIGACAAAEPVVG